MPTREECIKAAAEAFLIVCDEMEAEAEEALFELAQPVRKKSDSWQQNGNSSPQSSLFPVTEDE